MPSRNAWPDLIGHLVLLRPGSQVAGQVVWFAGEEVERYAHFKDWFEDKVASHQRALDRLRTMGRC